MARLPNPGSDDNVWGTILNDFLLQVHNADGTIKDATIGTNALSNGAVTAPKLDNTTQAKLNAAVPNSVTVNGKALSSNITLSASDVGAMSNASGANGRYLGYGTQLPSSGMQAGDIFLLISGS